jgi:hypothetical protein
METAEEEHEQAVVTSSSSPNSVVDILDSMSFENIYVHVFLLSI